LGHDEGDSGAVDPDMILISTHDECGYADLIEASPAVGFLAKTDLSAATIQRMRAEVDGRSSLDRSDWGRGT
jgi:hypothetical protein